MNNRNSSPRGNFQRAGRSSGRRNFGGGGSSSSGGGYQGNRGNRGGGRGGYGRNKPTIDIATFIKKAQQSQPGLNAQEEHIVSRTFADFNLHPSLKANIDAIGFASPTPIQDQAIDLVLEGNDVLGIANTGTGKTGAFLIPLIQQMLQDENKRILIVAPTRELAGQINDSFIQLAKGLQRFSVQCIGGMNMGKQINQLQRNHHALIGTPGRIMDLNRRGKLNLGKYNVVVLDEVDRMLDMGFVNDIRTILQDVPNERQSLYFSATITQRVSGLINDFSRNVKKVSVKTNETADMVSQEVINFKHEEQKIEVLHEILISEDVIKTLIFGRTKHGVKNLMFKLRDRGFRTESIHGNKSQSQRQRALTAFKESHVDILVATDVAARGLDVDDVSHVINYEIPDSFDDYIHRIGRTGRGGKRGVAYTFVK